MSWATVSVATSGTRHRVEFRLLLRSEQGADLRLRAVHELPHLGAFVVPRQRVIAHDSLALRSVALDDRRDLVGLLRREIERLLQALQLLHRIALPALRGAGFGTLFSAGSGRRWGWRRRLRRFIGGAEGGPGGGGKAGRDHCGSERKFHAITVWRSNGLRFSCWSGVIGMTPPASHGYRVLPVRTRPQGEDHDDDRKFGIGGQRCGIYFGRRCLHCQRHMIEVSSLTKCYGEFTAVHDLSFVVRAGEVMGLVGPNGAGKTTTLRCCTGVIPPTRGAIRIDGIDLAADPVAAKHQLAFFPDEPRLFEYLTVWQHLVFVARLYGVADFDSRAESLLVELEMADKKDLLPGELSRGMKQKLAIACGLLHAPRVIFFDEPLTGLDPAGIRRMKDTMRRLARDGAAIILSSHLLSLLEEVCTHVLILKAGEKIADGSLADVRRRFAEQPDASLEDVFFKATGDDRLPPVLKQP